MRKKPGIGSERLFIRGVLIGMMTLVCVIMLAIPAWGEEASSSAPFFKNITIETLGNQSYDMATNTITNKGHARMTVDDAVIEADSLVYYGDPGLTVASGNVRVISGSITLTADKLTLEHRNGWIEASGGVQIISPVDNYRTETVRYNLRTKQGTMGRFQGVVKGEKDFHVTGERADFDDGKTIMYPAGLSRTPREDYADYVFDAKKIVVQGDMIYMEKVVMKILGVPILYLPKLPLSGVSLPRVNVSASQGNNPDLNEVISESQAKELKAKETDAQASPAASSKPELHVSPNYDVDFNTDDKPSRITVGRIYKWGRYSDEIDLNFDSEGIFSLTDFYQVDWQNYNLLIDGKTDLNTNPKQELGLTLTKKAWKTDYGNWQVQLLSRWLYKKASDRIYQGVYAGYRLDYQFNPDLSISYLDLADLSGDKTDWERLEKTFMIIREYRLGGNLLYELKVPLHPHYYVFNTGSYNFRYDSWTSTVWGLMREVDSVRMGIGWDFVKQLVEMHFHLNF